MKVVIVSLLTFLICAKGFANPTFKERPNIVFFMVDDMGWQDHSVPFHSSKWDYQGGYRTPHMERLAKSGIRFSQAYACSVCTPSRVSLLTGKNASRHHVTNWTARGETSHASPELLPPSWRKEGLQPSHESTLPQLLQKAGYRTIHVGKAHWGAFDTPGANPLHLGFTINIAGNAAGQPGSYEGLDDYCIKMVKTNSVVTPPMPGMDSYLGKDIHLTDALTDAACQQMEKAVANRNIPFFLHFAHYAVHTPWQPHRPHDVHYRNSKMSKAGIAYASMIEGVDASLGMIMQKIKDLGIGEETVLVFYSDNGGVRKGMRAIDFPSSYRPRLREGKGSAYEGGIRVPAMVSWVKPNPHRALQQSFPIKGAAYCERPIMIEDWFPTILRWAHSLPPENQQQDGDDLISLLANPSLAERSSSIIWHAPNVWAAYGVGDTSGYQPHSAIRAGDWKAIYFYESERWELYHIADDQAEKNNLSEKNPVQLSKMSHQLYDHLQSMKSPWPVDRKTHQPRVMKLPLSTRKKTP